MAGVAKKHDINKAVDIIKKFGVKRIILFGSCAKSETGAGDIDIAVSGIKADMFFVMMGRLFKELDSRIDIVDLDEVDDYFVGKIVKEGRELL